MMQKINTNLDSTKVESWFETKYGEKWFLPYRFHLRIDVKNKEYTENENSKYPTINDLISSGFLKVKFGYDEISLDYKKYPNRISVKKAIAFFKSKGYNVTEEAIIHNFKAWRMNYKSGYRDETNGYHLFTPCGCNPLSFRLTSLYEPSKDWQITYEC